MFFWFVVDNTPRAIKIDNVYLKGLAVGVTLTSLSIRLTMYMVEL